jgi:hypothetical protein
MESCGANGWKSSLRYVVVLHPDVVDQPVGFPILNSSSRSKLDLAPAAQMMKNGFILQKCYTAIAGG